MADSKVVVGNIATLSNQRWANMTLYMNSRGEADPEQTNCEGELFSSFMTGIVLFNFDIPDFVLQIEEDPWFLGFRKNA
jgi:hypothetical protein